MSKKDSRKGSTFRFKRFEMSNWRSAMRISTDGIALGAWAAVPEGVERPRILDVGCGTGVLSLMLAQRCAEAEITAIDIEAEACLEAAENAQASPFGARIAVECRDFVGIGDWEPGIGYDLVVSNPPFFTETLRSADAVRALARHEGGLSVGSLLRLTPAVLAPGGQLAFIAPSQRDAEIEFEATMEGWHVVRCCRLCHREGSAPVRTLWQMSRRSDAAVGNLHESLAIRSAGNGFSPQWRELLKDYLIDF